MKANEIRKRFIEFFNKNNHHYVSSSPLIPINDPTLLFANAGMNQFKNYFTGKEKPKYNKAVSIQKCVRAGGKHNDLENVGYTPRHHTFFEMLGNFSFGDYFKKDAIAMAWKFLTEELKIPKEKLLVTVHESDKESALIWEKDIGVDKDCIFFLGDKDNFWEMGDVGPCGPCSEIFYDHGAKFSDGKKYSLKILDEKRYVEIWNLVFMQYEKLADGSMVNLPKPSVDTGCGLERLSSVMQQCYWNYDTDLFMPIIQEVEKITNKSYHDKPASMRIISDHMRSMTMLITDGVIPDSDGRGYVLRRIIRRATRHLSELGCNEVKLHTLVKTTLDTLKDQYPENNANIALAQNILKQEEGKFRETLSSGMKILNDEMRKIQKDKKLKGILSGETAFKLYDTFGFPLDLTETIVKEKSIQLDKDGFDQAMKKQKDLSRKSSKFKVQEGQYQKLYPIKDQYGPTLFLGHEHNTASAKLLSMEDFGDFYTAIFDRTPFYGESGGQAGDVGTIQEKANHGDNKVICRIVDTQKILDDLVVHIIAKDKSIPNIQEQSSYNLCIDCNTRDLTRKNHSATHLLQAALTQVLGDHVKQAGSLVTAKRLRFDFTHGKALSPTEIYDVQELVNRSINESIDVKSTIMDRSAAEKIGARALFGEKYGETVRVINMDDFSIELCGGTHVKNTKDIGFFFILSDSSLSSGVRRIEALTSQAAIDYLSERNGLLTEIEKFAGVQAESVKKRIQDYQQELKTLKKQIDEVKSQLQSLQSKSLTTKEDFNFKGRSVFIIENNFSPKEFKPASDKLINESQTGVFVLIDKSKDKFSFLIRSHKENKDDFQTFIKEFSGKYDARGGGKPDLVQGSANIKDIGAFYDSFKNYLQD